MTTARRFVRRCAFGLALATCVATAAHGQAAPADCDGSGVVTIDELTRAVAIALGSQPLSSCQAADVDGDGGVDVAELIAGVRVALGQGRITPTAAPTPTPTVGFKVIDIGDAFNQVGGVVPFCVELFGPEDVASLTVDLCLSADVFVADAIECSADVFECPISIDPETLDVSPTEHFPTCDLDGDPPRGQVRTSVQSAAAGTALPLGTLLGCRVQVRDDALPGVYPVAIRATAVRLGGETLVSVDTANANVSPLGPGGECLGDAQCDPQICRGGRCCACACTGTCDNFGECSVTPCFGTFAAED